MRKIAIWTLSTLAVVFLGVIAFSLVGGSNSSVGGSNRDLTTEELKTSTPSTAPKLDKFAIQREYRREKEACGNVLDLPAGDVARTQQWSDCNELLKMRYQSEYPEMADSFF